MSKLVLFSTLEVENIALKKDFALFPIYLKRFFDEVEICYFAVPNNDFIPLEYRGIKLTQIGKINHFFYTGKKAYLQGLLFYKSFMKYLKTNQDITHIMFFHFDYMRLLWFYRYKKKFPNIKIYVKLDINVDRATELSSNNLNVVKKRLINNYLEYVDLFTCETKQCLTLLTRNPLFLGKTFLAPNGFDDKYFSSTDMIEKEKLIITVGRLGSEPKNTELLLRVCKKLDFKDWKIKLIGPYENSFEDNIKSFYKERFDLKGNVFFTGAITDITKLIQEYKKASVFVLSSKWESSGLVLVEAALNGCYLISTDVGCIRDLSTLNKWCFIASQSKQGQQAQDVIEKEFTRELQAIIDGKNVCNNMNNRIDYYKKNYLMSSIVDKDFYKKFLEGE